MYYIVYLMLLKVAHFQQPPNSTFYLHNLYDSYLTTKPKLILHPNIAISNSTSCLITDAYESQKFHGKFQTYFGKPSLLLARTALCIVCVRPEVFALCIVCASSSGKSKVNIHSKFDILTH